jgi:hypothetical protein
MRLGRPVTNAVVDIHWLKSVSADHIQTATFHKVKGRWKLRGVGETLQALLAHQVWAGLFLLVARRALW